MKVTLQISGQEMTFSEQELTAILEKHFSDGTTKTADEYADTPTEGKWFKVTPGAINRELFQEERTDSKQEETRQYILEAFSEWESNPEKYTRTFDTYFPKYDFELMPVGQMKNFAEKIGRRQAEWVEQALEWAQRIQNGELWADVCNKMDTARLHRLVTWKDGYCRIVGGSRLCGFNCSASNIDSRHYSSGDILYYTVPLVVR